METKNKTEKNKLDSFVSLDCKVCSKKYTINTRNIEKMPLWMFENCSKECHKMCSEKKFANKNCCTIPLIKGKYCV